MARYRTNMAELLKKVQEDGHEDVSSSKRMCQTIIEDATQIRTKLDSMSAEDKLDTWWTNKLAKSADNMNSARDYIMNPIEENFEFSLDEGRMKDIYTMQQDGKSAREIAKLMKLPVKTVKDILGEEDLEEKIRPFLLSYSKGGSHEGFADADTLPELQKKAQDLRRKGFTIDKMGRNMAMKFAKEEVELVEFSDAMLNKLAREYEPLRGKTMSVQQANKLRQIFNMVPDRALDALRRKKIPFLSGLALSRMIQKGMPVKEELEERTYDPTMFGPDKVAKAMAIATKSSGNYTKAVKDIEKIARNLSKVSTIARELKKQNEQVEQPEKEKKEKEEKESENKDTQIRRLIDQIAVLKQKLENEKNKAVKPEPNPETGEVPLTIGLANKLLKDKEMKKEDVQEAFAVQITKKDGSKLIHGRFHTKSKADEFIKWYKTGDMKDTKDIKIVLEDIQEADLTKPQIKKVHKMADELPKKDFKDRYGKEKGDAVRYATATNIVKKKLGIEENLGDIFMKKFAKKDNKADMMFKILSQRAQTHVNDLLRTGMGTMDAIKKAKEKFNEGNMKNEEMRLRVEKIAGLKKKAEKSGMPYSILKKVFDRGMAAWKGGHRPGASQHQWAFARVNSFVTKSSGTWGGADKDLAKQVRGSK